MWVRWPVLPADVRLILILGEKILPKFEQDLSSPVIFVNQKKKNSTRAIRLNPIIFIFIFPSSLIRLFLFLLHGKTRARCHSTSHMLTSLQLMLACACADTMLVLCICLKICTNMFPDNVVQTFPFFFFFASFNKISHICWCNNRSYNYPAWCNEDRIDGSGLFFELLLNAITSSKFGSLTGLCRRGQHPNIMIYYVAVYFASFHH